MGSDRNPADTKQSILVVGGDGAIGRRLINVLEQDGLNILGSTRRQVQRDHRRVFIDLTETSSCYQLPTGNLRAAFLCASVTSMECCRIDPARTRQININNTVALAKQLVNRGAQVIFLSSNTVFDGETAFARATDVLNPQTEYGWQKAEAEKQLLGLDGQVSVVRFSKIIAPDMQLLNGWIGDLRAGRVIRPFSDIVMAPLSISFALELLRRVLDKRITGIIQASASEDISYEYAARYLAEKVGAKLSMIEPVSHLQLHIPDSPKNTTLEMIRLKELGLDVQRSTFALDQITHAYPSRQ